MEWHLYYVFIMEIYVIRITFASSSNATLTIPNNCALNGSGSVSGNGTTGNGGIHFSISRWGHLPTFNLVMELL